MTKVFHLRSRRQALLFVLAIAIPVGLVAARAARIAAAGTLADSLEAARLRRAIALDPSDPQPHYALGMVYLAGTEGSLAQALSELHQAIALNPRIARYWSGLAQACYAAGDQTCADDAFQRATVLAPRMPEFAWEATVNQVMAGRRDPALAQAGRFLQLQPGGAWQVFELLRNGFNDPEAIWCDLLRSFPDSKVKLAYLDFLGAENRFDLAARYWAEIAAGGFNITFAAAQPFLERSLAGGHYREAAAVWDYLLNRGAVARPNGDGKNLVFNGGFQREPLEAGFDWRSRRQPYVEENFDDPAGRNGGRALRIDFAAPHNEEDEPVYQYVSVTPGAKYELAGYVRTETITSDSGPRLRVIDPKCPTCLDVATEGATGTTPWHEIRVQFAAGPDTDAVRVSVWRPRSRSFPMEISGQAWFTDISVRPLASN